MSAGESKFRKVAVCAGAGSGSTFRKISDGSGACYGVGSGGKFQRVPVGFGRFLRVSEGSGVRWCTGVGSGGKFRNVPEGCGEFRCVLVWVPEVGFGRFQSVPVWSVALRP